jgi:hypothetical protein
MKRKENPSNIFFALHEEKKNILSLPWKSGGHRDCTSPHTCAEPSLYCFVSQTEVSIISIRTGSSQLKLPPFILRRIFSLSLYFKWSSRILLRCFARCAPVRNVLKMVYYLLVNDQEGKSPSISISEFSGGFVTIFFYFSIDFL